MKIFLRPSFRRKHYGKLGNIAAVEPPARMLQLSGDTPFFDEEIGEVVPKGVTDITLCPHGNYPFAIYRNIKDCLDLKKKMAGEYNVQVIDRHKNVDGEIPYHKVSLKSYRPHLWHFMTANSGGYATTYLSSSCKYSCRFCFVKDHYGDYWERKVDNAVGDVVRIVSQGVTNIKMLDEIFLADNERVRLFLKKIQPLGNILNIWGYARIDTINESIVKLAKKSGVRWLAVGIESSNPGTRARLGKGKFTNQQVERSVKTCEDNGIEVMANYIVGLDGETEKDFEDTKRFAVKLNTSFINVYSYIDYGKDGNMVLTGGKFRKKFFSDYFRSRRYIGKLKERVGITAVKAIKQMLSLDKHG